MRRKYTRLTQDDRLGALDEEDWTPLGNLAAAILVAAEEPEKRHMAFFSAYFDSSGDGVNQPRVVVSGYIANYGQWKLFEKSWDLAHSDFGLTRPFHMTEFIAALERPESYKRQKRARQDYLKIAETPDRAIRFLRALTNIQMCGVVCGISAIIDMQIYDSVNSVLNLKEVVPPYALGARMCIANVHGWENYFHVSEPVECVFEEGDLGQGKFTNLMIDEGDAHPIYKKKDDFAALQAADMYAWEQTHFLRKYGINPQADARQEFGMLLHAIPKIHTHAPVEVLINLCHAKGIDIREIK